MKYGIMREKHGIVRGAPATEPVFQVARVMKIPVTIVPALALHCI